MTWNEAFPYTFKNLRKKFNIPEPSKTDMVDDCRADDSDFCLEVADQARRKYHLDITVSSLLEDHATPDQKQRCIDLVDYIFENS